MTKPDGIRLTVCDGGTCKTSRRRLQTMREHAAVRLADCLGPCEQSNVVVAHRKGSRPIWLGLLNTDAAVLDLAEWAATGGPLPPILELHLIPGRQRPAKRR